MGGVHTPAELDEDDDEEDDELELEEWEEPAG